MAGLGKAASDGGLDDRHTSDHDAAVKFNNGCQQHRGCVVPGILGPRQEHTVIGIDDPAHTSAVQKRESVRVPTYVVRSTYRKPSMKTEQTLSFFSADMFRPTTTGIGMITR